MKRLFLIVMMSLSIAETKVETITCAETIRMSFPVHSDISMTDHDRYMVTTVIKIDVSANPWLQDIYPGCTDYIYVKGVGMSSRLRMAEELALLEARVNAVCIGHPHYEQYRVYTEYWNEDGYGEAREQQWFRTVWNKITNKDGGK